MSYPTLKNREYMRARYAMQRDFILDKLGGECRRCGSAEELEVDHVDWRTKEFGVGRLWAEKQWHHLLAELDKCQLLCKPCHIEKTKWDLREQTAELGRSWRHGTTTGFQKKGCDCPACEQAGRDFYDRRNARRRELSGGKGKGKYGRPSTHGDPLHYGRGCRCDLCRKANADAARERAAAKRAANSDNTTE
jgi:hypothetical protein